MLYVSQTCFALVAICFSQPNYALELPPITYERRLRFHRSKWSLISHTCSLGCHRLNQQMHLPTSLKVQLSQHHSLLKYTSLVHRTIIDFGLHVVRPHYCHNLTKVYSRKLAFQISFEKWLTLLHITGRT